MRMITISILILLLSGCKFETKEQKLKRVEKEACALAYKYASECAFELTGIGVEPFGDICTKEFADKVLSYSCEEMF